MTVATYVSKPVEVRAVKYNGRNMDEIYRFAGEAVTLYPNAHPDQRISVHTKNGTVDLLVDHWLIEGVADFYPCDQVTFASRWAKKEDDETVASNDS